MAEDLDAQSAGADPMHGNPSAVETAAFFELPDTLRLLRR
jgi:hypothetical protein